MSQNALKGFLLRRIFLIKPGYPFWIFSQRKNSTQITPCLVIANLNETRHHCA